MKNQEIKCVIQRESDFPGQEHLASFSVKAYSRTGKEWKNIDHILQSLKGFFFHNADAILDATLTIDDQGCELLDLREIKSI